MIYKWKEMIEDDLKEELREYVTLEEFFGEIRKEFGRKGKGKKVEEDIWGKINSYSEENREKEGR